LQAAQGNAETKACKRVFFSATQENFFSSLPFLMNLFSSTHGLTRNLTITSFNINHYLDKFVLTLDSNQHRTDRRASGNSGFASCGVKCLNSSAVFQFNFSGGLTVLCPEIPHERKAAKRQTVQKPSLPV
jgi:hypothetical protein